MSFIPSKEQIDVFNHINNSEKNLIVSAVAGSGKTTTLLEALDRISEKKTVLFMAFNRAINEELVRRAPKRTNILIKTVHGFGYSTLLDYNQEIKTNFYKYNNIFRNVLEFISSGDIEKIQKYNFKTPELKLIEKLSTIITDNVEFDEDFNVDEYGIRVIDLCDIARLYNVGNREKKTLNELADRHSILNTNNEAESAIILKRLGTYYTKEIDFTDMIYLPNALNLSCYTFDYVFIDECLPKGTYISTINGKKKLNTLYSMYLQGEKLPQIITYNEKGHVFETKDILKIWSNGIKEVYYVTLNGKRKIKSTLNHQFLTQRGWVRLDELKIGDGVVSNYCEQPYHPMLNEYQKDIFYGSILGDGNLDKMSESVNRLHVIHGESQKEYLGWKASIFNSKIVYIKENGYSKTPAYTFHTIGYYGNITKTIAIQSLNERSLAITWMDDGSLAKNELSSRLYALSSDFNKINELNDKLLSFGIIGKVCTTKSSSTGNICYYISFNKDMTDKISLLISPYIHKSMEYKIKLEHRKNISKWGEYIPPSTGYLVVTKTHQFLKNEEVLDISVEDNHNFIIPSSSYYSQAGNYGIVAHNCQDLNTCQRLMMLKAIKSGGKFIGVGDPSQCQPIGTKILKSNGDEINIENLKIGDRIVSYDRKTGCYVGYDHSRSWSDKHIERYGVRVTNIVQRNYTDNLFYVKSMNGDESKYTYNHKTVARFNKKTLNGCFLYLMERNGYFRVGIVSCWGKSEDNFASFRAKQEKADRFWILNFYPTQNLAYLDEQYYSIQYSIPQMRFIDRNQHGILDQDMIDNYYSKFDKSKLEHNSVILLNRFNKKLECPFWARNKFNYFSKNHIFEIEACNLMPDIMDIVVFDSKHFKTRKISSEIRITAKYETISEIIIEKYSGDVYSLEVEKHELYVADNILTHNSIYGFAGADYESYKKLCQIPNTEQLPLSTTFRCPNKVIELVRPLNSQIQPFESNPEGEIIESISYNDIQEGDMILCRQTFPIVSLCMRYLSQGKSAYIIGSDIGKSLISMITRNERKTEEYIMDNIFARLDREYDKILEKLISSHKLTKNEAENQNVAVSFREKVLALEAITGDLTDPNEVISKINNMFSDDNKKGICLSTIHKAKGLENDRVFILMRELMPSQYAKEPWEFIQEDNLRYVAYTRAKKALGFITDYNAYSMMTNAPRAKTAIKDSKHVGIVGEFKYLKLKVIDIKKFKTQFGDTKLYEMVDDDGNLFKKWGDIKARYIVGGGISINIETKVAFMGKIKSHGEYKGVKETIISNIM